MIYCRIWPACYCLLKIVLKVDFAMHFFVHGFFGKFAKQATEARDVVETTIANDTINNVFTAYTELKWASEHHPNQTTEDIYNQLTQLQCVMNSKDFPVLMRAIIKILNRQERRYNCNIIRELEIFSSLVKTAQYYERDIYWI